METKKLNHKEGVWSVVNKYFVNQEMPTEGPRKITKSERREIASLLVESIKNGEVKYSKSIEDEKKLSSFAYSTVRHFINQDSRYANKIVLEK